MEGQHHMPLAWYPVENLPQKAPGRKPRALSLCYKPLNFRPGKTGLGTAWPALLWLLMVFETRLTIYTCSMFEVQNCYTFFQSRSTVWRDLVLYSKLSFKATRIKELSFTETCIEFLFIRATSLQGIFIPKNNINFQM